ncbi:hypothetical protein [Methylocystis sp. S23]
MTPAQRELARHALGLPNEQKRSYRNRYYVDATASTGRQWLIMRSRGFAEMVPLPECVADFFALTRAGAEMALDPGESLDQEDFPKIRGHE